MGFHFRKSFKCGPIRFNLSNSGIGYSVGIKGLRVGVDGKGRNYIGGGKGVLRYRKTLGKLTQEEKEKFKNTFSLKPLGILLHIIFTLILPSAIFFYFVFSILLVQINGFLMLAAWGLGIYLLVLLFKKYFGLFINPIELKLAKIALLKYNAGDYKEALEECERIENKKNNNLLCSFDYNFIKLITNIKYDCYIGLNEYENALNYIETSQARIFLSYRERKVTCLYKLGMFKELISFLQAEYTDEERDKHPSYYALLGEAFLNLGQKEAALEALLQGPVKKRSMDSEMCAFRYALGMCYEARSDKTNALKQYQKIYAYDTSFENVAQKIEDLKKMRS